MIAVPMSPTLLGAEMARLALPLLVGLLVGAIVDRAARPRIRSEASPWTELIGAGLWLAAFASAAWVTGRPIVAACALLAMHAGLVALGNAKHRACGEPLVFADLAGLAEGLLDSRRGPPWLDARAALAWTLLAATALGGIATMEHPLAAEAIVPLAVLLAVAIAMLRGATRLALDGLTLDPIRDLARFGFAAGLWLEGMAQRHRPTGRLRGARWPARIAPAGERLPHVVCVQAGAFFDARRLHPTVRRDVLARMDALAAGALHRGRLAVPPSGGAAARAEHAFLTGVPPAFLGVERFDPHRYLEDDTATMARHLREAGYQSVCVAPHADIVARRPALEAMGFDAVVDASLLGAVGDIGLAEAVLRLVEESGDTPLFVHVIAMPGEPRAASRPARPEDVAAVYGAPPPPGCERLTGYLRRLRDLDAMVARLAEGLRWLERDTVACVYGAHVPSLPEVYDAVGLPDGRTDYLVWRAHREALPRVEDRAVEEIAAVVLAEALRVPAPARAAASRNPEPFTPRAAIIRSSVGA